MEVFKKINFIKVCQKHRIKLRFVNKNYKMDGINEYNQDQVIFKLSKNLVSTIGHAKIFLCPFSTLVRFKA